MSNANFVHLHTILSARLYGEVINYAARHEIPVSDIVNRAVKDYLAAQDNDSEAARRGRLEMKAEGSSK